MPGVRGQRADLLDAGEAGVEGDQVEVVMKGGGGYPEVVVVESEEAKRLVVPEVAQGISKGASLQAHNT